MALALNLNLPNVEVKDTSRISVFYKHFQPDNTGRFIPTLYRNNVKKAKQQFLEHLAETKKLILRISATTDIAQNEYFQLCNQQDITFKSEMMETLTADVNTLIKQVIETIETDENTDLYEKVSIDLIVKDKESDRPQTKEVEIADELPF